MGKSANETQQIIEEMVANNYQQANERDNRRKHANIYELDDLNLLSAKIDNVVKMLNKQGEIGSSSTISIASCTLCGGNYDDTNCVNFEQIQYVNNFSCPTQNDPYCNTYNQGWENHSNFRQRDQGIQQRPKQTSIESKISWELAIEKLINTTNSNIDRLVKTTSEIFERLEKKMDQLMTM